MMLRVIKMTIGATIAVAIAQSLGLVNTFTAGIIVLLSVSATKKSTLRLAVTRIASTTLGLTLGSIIFSIFGFHVLAFAIYLAIFLPLCFKFSLDDGIVPSTVLTTHLLIHGSLDAGIVTNTAAIFLIGLSIALIVNLYMPSMKGEVLTTQKWIEENFRVILLAVADCLEKDAAKHEIFKTSLLEETENLIDQAILKATQQRENQTFFGGNPYLLDYLQMRKMQFNILTGLFELTQGLTFKPEPVTGYITNLTKETVLALDEHNTGDGLLAQLENLRLTCQELPLPQTRQEFESRAVLFQYLSEFKQFIEIKKRFSATYLEV